MLWSNTTVHCDVHCTRPSESIQIWCGQLEQLDGLLKYFFGQLKHMSANSNACRPAQIHVAQLNFLSANSTTCRPTQLLIGQLKYLLANSMTCRPTQLLVHQLKNLSANSIICGQTIEFFRKLKNCPTNSATSWGDSLQIFLIHSCLASDMFIGYLFSKYATSKSTTTSGNTGPILMLLLTCNVMLKICYISLPINFL